MSVANRTDNAQRPAPEQLDEAAGEHAVAEREQLEVAAERGRSLLHGSGFSWLRFGVDVGMLLLATVGAVVGASRTDAVLDDAWALAVFPPLALAVMYRLGLYRARLRQQVIDDLFPTVGAISIAIMTVLGTTAVFSSGSDLAPLIARTWVFALVFVGGGRIMLDRLQRWARLERKATCRTLIVGAGVVATHVARRLESHPEYGLQVVGYLDADPLENLPDRRAPVLGSPADLAAVVEQTGAEHVILAFSREPDHGLVPLVRRCAELGVDVSIVPRLYESINERVALEHLGGLPLLALRTIDPKGWQFEVKHALDRIAAVVLLIAASPLLLAGMLAVKLSSPGPLLFRQERVGRDGRHFDLLKLRSMRVPEADQTGDPRELLSAPDHAPGGVEGEDRRTAVGRFLRRTSIDELPQLLNVLRGDMSLVGPRPERPEFARLFDLDIARYDDRHRVKSGITGWAQVHGFRGQTSLADRVEWDNFYIENWSLWLDFKILLLTPLAVLRGPDED